MISKINPENLKNQIRILFNALQGGTLFRSFYLDKYISNLLGKSPNGQNSNWQILGAFPSLNSAFRNISDPLNFDQGGQILAHPLIPKEVIEILDEIGDITSLDLSKETLNWNPVAVQQFLEANKMIASVIFYATNGLYAEITESLKLINRLNRPVRKIIIVDQPLINEELVDLINTFQYTDFIWNLGPNPIYQLAKPFLERPEHLTTDCFVSWHTKEEDAPILTLDKQKPSQELQDFLEAYLYLLLDKQANISRLRGSWAKTIYTRFFFNLQIKSPEEAKAILEDSLEEMPAERIPDILFKLMNLPFQSEPGQNWHLIKAQKLYDFLLKKTSLQAEGSLEIPPLFTNRDYLEYFFFTTDPDRWAEYFGQKRLTIDFFELGMEFESLEQAKFIEKYGLRVGLARKKQNPLLGEGGRML